MVKNKLVVCIVSLICISTLSAQSENQMNKSRHAISTSAFVLYNIIPDDDPPNFYQLNYLYRFNDRQSLSIEAITWTYKGPLGRPYGPHYEDDASDYPGTARSTGIGLAYKHFIKGQWYGAIHSVAFKQVFRDREKNKLGTGFQLFNTARIGYQFELMQGKIFIEPSIACTYWPINNGLPEQFQIEENKWNNYFLFEPGCHIGFNF